jgi:outer membrane protein W
MRIRFVLALLLSLAALPLAAQSNDLGLWYASARLKDTPGFAFNDATGYGISYNHFWTRALSTELTAHWLRADAGIEIGGVRAIDAGRMEMKPISADVQWHFARRAMLSPYAGAGVTFMRRDELSNADLDAAGIGAIEIERKITWNANAGVNIGISRTFAVGVDAKYIPYEPDAKAAGTTEKLKFNPLLFSAGVKLRW